MITRQFRSNVQEGQKKANVELVQDVDKENTPVKLQLMSIALIKESGVGLARKIKKVAQRSYYYENYMWKMSL